MGQVNDNEHVCVRVGRVGAVVNGDDGVNEGAEDAETAAGAAAAAMPLEGCHCHRHRWIVQGIFLLLGVGVLVPWNAFISAKQYYVHRLCERQQEHQYPPLNSTGSDAVAVAVAVAYDYSYADGYAYSYASADTDSGDSIHYVVDPAAAHIESTFAMLFNLAAVLTMGMILTIQAAKDQWMAFYHRATATATGLATATTHNHSHHTPAGVVIPATTTTNTTPPVLQNAVSNLTNDEQYTEGDIDSNINGDGDINGNINMNMEGEPIEIIPAAMATDTDPLSHSNRRCGNHGSFHDHRHYHPHYHYNNNQDEGENQDASSVATTVQLQGHSFWLVMLPLTLYFAVFVGQTVMVGLTQLSPVFFWNITLLGLALCGMCSTVATAGIVAAASLLDGDDTDTNTDTDNNNNAGQLAMSPFLMGQSLGGVLVSLANFGAALMGNDSEAFWKLHCSSSSNTDSNHTTNLDLFQGTIAMELISERRLSLESNENSNINGNDRLDSQRRQQETCVPYQEQDWAVFGYFLLSSFVLAACLLGYQYIDRVQRQRHHDHHNNINNTNNTNTNISMNRYIPTTTRMSPANYHYETITGGTDMDGCHMESDDGEFASIPQVESDQDILLNGQQQQQPLQYTVMENGEELVEEDERIPAASPRLGLEMNRRERRPSRHTSNRNEDRQRENCPGGESRQQQQQQQLQLQQRQHADNYLGDSAVTAASEALAGSSSHLEINETGAVWTIVRGPAITIYLTFLVTLGLFPGWTSELHSIHQCQIKFRLANDLYTPFTFLLFNIGDLTGRGLSSLVPLHRIRNASQKLVLAAVLRLLFFPLLFLCTGGGGNISPSSSAIDSGNSMFESWQFSSDMYSVLVQFAFAVTNGLFVTLAFVHAPTLLPNTTHVQERSSEILTFAVALGLLSGSLLSYPVSQLATK